MRLTGRSRLSSRSFLERLGLLLAGVLVAVLLGEGVTRLLFPYLRDHALPMALVTTDEDLGWKLSRNEHTVHETTLFRVDYVTNSYGFRDPPRGNPKGPGRHRILLYGDSQVFGWGVEADQRFSNLLEERLPALEVWNLAVPGYGLDQQVLHYQRDAGHWRADEVVFYVSVATRRRMQLDYSFGIHKPHFVLDQDQRLQVIPPRRMPGRHALYRLPRWMYLPYALDRALLRTVGQGNARVAEPAALGEAGLVALALRLARDLSEQRGQRLTVLADLPEAERQRLVEECAFPGVEHLDVGLPRDDESYMQGKRDRHWNARAHQRIAAHLEPAIRSRRRAAPP